MILKFFRAHRHLCFALLGLLALAVTILILTLTRPSASDPAADTPTVSTVGTLPETTSDPDPEPEPDSDTTAQTPNKYNSSNCTTAWGALTLINPNFTVDISYISQRQSELINLTATYGITESGGNGTPHLDAEAASHLNDLNNTYKSSSNGHTLTTRSCFRPRGTTCGRLCAATGTSDHHTGYTCDLIDPSYGTALDTDDYNNHPEWQWLRAHAHEYGFIDRFPEAWAGGSMSQPLNINETGTTGLYETWHYRYVGVTAATEIATGKYNNGKYDSLEHYLKATGRLSTLTDMAAACSK